MLTNDVVIHAFQPVWLTVQGYGPFPESPYEIDFTDTDNAPCSFFLLMSDNGKGKTTALNLMACLMRMLGERDPREFGLESLDQGELNVQWDVRVTLTWQGKERSIILSLLAGTFGDDQPVLKPWGESECARHQAGSWHRTGFHRRAKSFLDPIGRSDELVSDLVGTIQDWQGESPKGFEEDDFNLPTLLYFSAYRDIPSIVGLERNISQPEHWGYQPAHVFAPHANHWSDSLDNLAVWLSWVDEKRFTRAQGIINERVFEGTAKFLAGIRKVPPEAIVRNGEGSESEHRLDRLSSGEKNLVQLFLRIGAHMTRNTLILIDEPEVHLHPRWQHRLMRHLKEFLCGHPNCTLIAATHSLEMLQAFGFESPEANLRKGGFLLTKDMQ